MEDRGESFPVAKAKSMLFLSRPLF